LSLRDIWAEEDLWEKQFAPGSKPFPLEDEAVAVLEINGHFSMLSLPDGELQIDSSVNPEPSLTDIHELRTPTRHLLVTNRPPTRSSDNVQFSQTNSQHFVNGYLHGFDRRTGKLLYSNRVENRTLILGQPADLPVLAFVATVPRPMIGPNTDVAVMCVDKRNGKILADEKSTGAVGQLDMTGDLEKNRVVLRLPRLAIQLTFTDKPQPDKAGAEKKAGLPSRAGRAMARGLERWIDGFSASFEELQLPQ
jgi:hypothetical protein